MDGNSHLSVARKHVRFILSLVLISVFPLKIYCADLVPAKLDPLQNTSKVSEFLDLYNHYKIVNSWDEAKDVGCILLKDGKGRVLIRVDERGLLGVDERLDCTMCETQVMSGYLNKDSQRDYLIVTEMHGNGIADSTQFVLLLSFGNNYVERHFLTSIYDEPCVLKNKDSGNSYIVNHAIIGGNIARCPPLYPKELEDNGLMEGIPTDDGNFEEDTRGKLFFHHRDSLKEFGVQGEKFENQETEILKSAYWDMYFDVRYLIRIDSTELVLEDNVPEYPTFFSFYKWAQGKRCPYQTRLLTDDQKRRIISKSYNNFMGEPVVSKEIVVK
jgi:hypothetical protein